MTTEEIKMLKEAARILHDYGYEEAAEEVSKVYGVEEDSADGD